MVTIVIVIVLALLFGTAEILDWVGRLEIIERRWPRVYAAVSNRVARLVALVFLIALTGHDIEKRTEVPEPPKVTIAAPLVPQFSATTKVVTRTLPAPEAEKTCWLSHHFGLPNSTVKGAVTTTAVILSCNYKIDAPFSAMVECDSDFINVALL